MLSDGTCDSFAQIIDKLLKETFQQLLPWQYIQIPYAVLTRFYKHFSIVSARGLASIHTHTPPMPSFLPQPMGSEPSLQFTLHLEFTRHGWTQVSYCIPNIASLTCLIFLFENHSIHKGNQYYLKYMHLTKGTGRLGNNPAEFFGSEPEK